MDLDLASVIDDQFREALKKRGRLNLLVAGRSGVGKSTLINAVFQGNLAETGQGRPITRDIKAYSKEGIPLTLFDSRGLEMEKYPETLAALEKLVADSRAHVDPHEHLHAAWVCVSEDSRRVEEGESKVTATLAKAGIPVIVVITRARADQGFQQTVKTLMPEASQVVRVRALGEVDDDGHVLHPKGLEELVLATLEIVPEAHRNAFTAAQRVSLQLKRTRAHLAVASAATLAAAIGAAPIPFADAVLLVPLQVGMLAGITAVWGLPVDTAFLSTIVSSAATSVGATFAGRSLVGALLKLMPGGGSLLGGAINASTAAFMTTLFGEAYIAALSGLHQLGLARTVTAEEVARAFDEELKKER